MRLSRLFAVLILASFLLCTSAMAVGASSDLDFVLNLGQSLGGLWDHIAWVTKEKTPKTYQFNQSIQWIKSEENHLIQLGRSLSGASTGGASSRAQVLSYYASVRTLFRDWDEYCTFWTQILPLMESEHNVYAKLDNAPPNNQQRAALLRSTAAEILQERTRLARVPAPTAYRGAQAEWMKTMQQDADLYVRFAQAIESGDRGQFDRTFQEFTDQRRNARDKWNQFVNGNLGPNPLLRRLSSLLDQGKALSARLAQE